MFLLMLETVLAPMLPAPLHRVGLRGAHALRRVWWRLRRSRGSGCRVLAQDAQGRVLLVRHSYGARDWMPPGGAMEAGEDPLAAAARELGEELGCTLKAPRVVAAIADTLRGSGHGSGGLVHIVVGQAAGTPRPDNREVVAAEFFAPDALPSDISPYLARKIPLWLSE